MTRLGDIPLAVFRRRWWFACAIAAGFFFWNFSMFWIPGKGFTYLVVFGDKWSDRYIPEVTAADVYIEKDSWGYDGLTYAQIAMRPSLTDPVLFKAIDNLPYRARRILFCWTAWLAGSGDPAQALFAYTLQNVVSWVLLAILMFRWFRQETLGDFVRWFGVLFSFGMFFSIRCSLVDGPSLLLIAVGIALAESRKPWLSAIVLGISGLGKETSIAAGIATDLPQSLKVREWLPFIARGLIIVLPVVLWYWYLASLFGTHETVGSKNFSLPFVAYFEKWREVFRDMHDGPKYVAPRNIAVLISLTTQLLFFACRPRWKDRWWRLGVAMSLLMVVIGPAVWAGYPCAAARVLLPMLLAFNVAVPRGWKWGIVLLLGNLSVLAAPGLFNPPPREAFRVTGPAALIKSADQYVQMDFKDGWFGIERSRLEYWRWSSGSATIMLSNPHPFAIHLKSEFHLDSREHRDVRILLGDQVLWEGDIDSDSAVTKLEFDLPPGKTRWYFETKLPPREAGGTDHRMLAFSLRDLKVRITGRAGK